MFCTGPDCEIYCKSCYSFEYGAMSRAKPKTRDQFYKHFTIVIYKWAEWVRVLVPVRGPFQLNLVFVDKVKTCPREEYLKLASSGYALALLVNIRLGWKGLPGTKYTSILGSSITAVKSFEILDPGCPGNTVQLFRNIPMPKLKNYKHF